MDSECRYSKKTLETIEDSCSTNKTICITPKMFGDPWRPTPWFFTGKTYGQNFIWLLYIVRGLTISGEIISKRIAVEVEKHEKQRCGPHQTHKHRRRVNMMVFLPYLDV